MSTNFSNRQRANFIINLIVIMFGVTAPNAFIQAQTASPLEVTITVSPSTFSERQQATALVKIKNISTSPVVIPSLNGQVQNKYFSLEIVHATGISTFFVGSVLAIKPFDVANSTIRLYPNQQLSFNLIVNESGSGFWGYQIPNTPSSFRNYVGNFNVRAKFTVDNSNLPTSGDVINLFRGTILSAPVTMQVTQVPTAGMGIEGDIAARPDGDGSILSNDVIQIRRFLNGTNTPSTLPNEFQRADSFPFEDKGDGSINSADVVQTRRYQNGTSPMQTAGGPLTAVSRPEFVTDKFDKTKSSKESPRQLRVKNATVSSGGQITVNILVNAVGDEAEYAFSLNYDQTQLSKPVIKAGNAGASVRSCNKAVAGQINCSVGGFPNNNPTSIEAGIGEIAAGNNQILITVTFQIAAKWESGTISLTLLNVNASSDAPQLFTLTAASVTVGGRDIAGKGRGIFRAREH